MNGKIDVLLDLHWGDCGKGKIVDSIAPEYDIICRFAGGNNSGHTIKFGDFQHVLHLIPSGIFHPQCINVIGNGVVIDPIELINEIEKLEQVGVDVKSRLIISEKAHLILPIHKLLDKTSEEQKGNSKIGSTLKGIGPAYTDKVSRCGLRVGDIFDNIDTKASEATVQHLYSNKNLDDYVIDPENFQNRKRFVEACEKLKDYTILDTTFYLNQALKEGKSILAEGAQGTLLDVDFGTYPFVTSSNTTIGGVVTGLGVPPTKVNRVIGIFKAYTTRVGSGPFPTELNDDIGELIRQTGNEFGATTGRPRRCGWLDLPTLKYSCMINGVTELHIMKLDVLSVLDEIKVCTDYVVNNNITDQVPYNFESVEDLRLKSFKGWKDEFISESKSMYELPTETYDFIKFVEKYLEIPVTLISVGPGREQSIVKT